MFVQRARCSTTRATALVEQQPAPSTGNMRPGSELFVVYTDDYDTESGPQSTGLRNRAFVIKVTRRVRP